MTREEAAAMLESIKDIPIDWRRWDRMPTQEFCDDMCESIDMAIEALQKSIPKPPNKDKDLSLLCPVCGEDVDWHKYCEECGQAIEWE